MYTIAFGTHKGWSAFGGMILALASTIIPLATSGMFGPKVGAVGVAAGVLIAGFSNAPGAPKVPTVTASLPSESSHVTLSSPNLISSS